MPQLDQSEQSVGSLNLAQQIDFVRGFLRRRYVAILSCLAIALTGATLYALTAPKSYTASAVMLMESRKGPFEKEANAARLDAAWVETQLQTLKTVNVIGYVVKQLHLADDPEFLRAESGLLDQVRARFGWSDPELKTEGDRVNRAIAILAGGLGAQRVGQSYMLKIVFRGHNPDQVAKIVNELVNGYIYDQMTANYQSSRRAGDWLQERLQTLRDQAVAAERAVLQFKAKNNIVAAGGSLIDDKHLANISEQLGSARAHTADLQARLERMDAVRQSYQTDQPSSTTLDESVMEAMNNPIIGQLRAKYLDLVNREADWSTRYGAHHLSVVNLRNQIRDIRRSIYDELGRIEETYKSEYEIGKKRQDDLEKALQDAVAKTQDTNQAQVTLVSLEAAAKSYRALYDNFLRQHTEAVQEQTYPVTDARLVSSASVAQSWNTVVIWLATVFAGGMLGVGFGALRDLMDRGFRTIDQVKSVLNTDCLGLIPRIGAQSSTRQLPFRNGEPAGVRLNAMHVPPTLESEEVTQDIEEGGTASRSKILWAAVDAPNSAYAEALRAIKLSLDADPPGACNVIGLTSCLPTEGKSTVAAGIATLMAQSGRRTILVDCDVRNPSLSRALAPDAETGFLEVITGKAKLAEAGLRDPRTKLAFLPTVVKRDSQNATEILASAEAKTFIDSLKATYDCIIIDMAPLLATTDVRAASRIADAYVLVIEWGATKMELVQHALSHAPGVQSKMIGAVLNKVDFASLGRYEFYEHGYYRYYGYGRRDPASLN